MGTLNIPVRYWAMHSSSPEEIWSPIRLEV